MSAESKKILKERILELFKNVCSGEPDTCLYGECRYLLKCSKDFYNIETLPKKNRLLENIEKNIKNRLNKAKGRTNPNFLGKGVHEIASTLVGCDIYEHELIKDCKWAAVAIGRCTTLNQVVEILDRRHINLYGRSKLWHYKN